MKNNIATANFIVAGVILLGLITRFHYNVWVVVDIGAIITCTICGIKLVNSG